MSTATEILDGQIALIPPKAEIRWGWRRLGLAHAYLVIDGKMPADREALCRRPWLGPVTLGVPHKRRCSWCLQVIARDYPDAS